MQMQRGCGCAIDKWGKEGKENATEVGKEKKKHKKRRRTEKKLVPSNKIHNTFRGK
jgi:hypothetical protein